MDTWVKYGYVDFLSHKLKRWKKRWIVFRVGQTASGTEIIKYKNEQDAQKGVPGRHTYPLKDITWAERMNPEVRARGVRVFLLNKQCDQICFSFESESAANEWVKGIRRLIGDIKDTFPVQLKDATHVTERGEMELTIGPINMRLSKDKVLQSMPLSSIKSYKGESNSCFWIQTTSRTSDTESKDDYLMFYARCGECILAKLDSQLNPRLSLGGRCNLEALRVVDQRSGIRRRVSSTSQKYATAEGVAENKTPEARRMSDGDVTHPPPLPTPRPQSGTYQVKLMTAIHMTQIGEMKLTIGPTNIRLSKDTVLQSIPLSSIKSYKGEPDSCFSIQTTSRTSDSESKDDNLMFYAPYGEAILAKLDSKLKPRITSIADKSIYEALRVVDQKDGVKRRTSSTSQMTSTSEEVEEVETEETRKLSETKGSAQDDIYVEMKNVVSSTQGQINETVDPAASIPDEPSPGGPELSPGSPEPSPGSPDESS